MHIRKLYKTIEAIGARSDEKEEDFLKNILTEIVSNEEIVIKGGRLWKFNPRKGAYELLHQMGAIEPIENTHRLSVRDYPIFLQLPQVRTIVADEQDKVLRAHGIHAYSATGIGEKLTWEGHQLYQYVMALNADGLTDNITPTLNIISSAVSSKLAARKSRLRTKALEKDLEKAREIQKSILPQHEMRFHSYELYGVSVADRVVGGDFFDYLEVEGDDERLGFVIGDAASKGLSAAVQALYTSGALSMGVQFQTKISSLLYRVNNLLNKTFSEEHFVTLFYGELTDDKNGLVLYSNCGHNSPILYRCATGQTEFLPPTGQIMGPFKGEKYKTENFLMSRGDVLFLYTDGVSEAADQNGNFYGEERAGEKLRMLCDKSAKEITTTILEDVQTFNAQGTMSDDVTILTVKRNS